MEPLAFVEVLGRHGDVLARHPVLAWPAHAGRGYDADVILDDGYVAPRHARIEPAADGRFRVTDLGSVNGLSLSPAWRRVDEAEVGPDDIVRLGRTQIRIRTPAYAVGTERRMGTTSAYRRPIAFIAAATLTLALTAWSAWLGTSSREEWTGLVVPIVAFAALVTVWISIWALVGRTVGGRANFAAHGFIACAALVGVQVLGTGFEYLSFGFDAHRLDYAGNAVIVAIAAYLLYRHLRLNSRAPRRRLAVIAAIVVGAGTGIIVGIGSAMDSRREGVLSYDGTVKPPAFLWVPGVAPEAFLGKAAELRKRADAFARAPDRAP
ncbi:MAG: FHA domain-containing protein [Burkholderiales bacterium]